MNSKFNDPQFHVKWPVLLEFFRSKGDHYLLGGGMDIILGLL